MQKRIAMDKDVIISNLQEENRQLKARIGELELVVENLQSQIKLLTTKKNSNNSSLPPSADLARKNNSLRTPSEKKSGGEQGHRGTTLMMTETPDEIHPLIPDYCNQCGKDLR